MLCGHPNRIATLRADESTPPALEDILRLMDPLLEIEDLVAFEDRRAGTDAERRASAHLVRTLESIGREATIEPTRVSPNYALAHLIHALLAVVGSVVAVSAPVVGLALIALAVVSTVGDLTGTFYLARRLTGRRASQNVVSREQTGRPGTLIFVAHYDAGRTGFASSSGVARRGAALGRRLHHSLGMFELMFWPMVVLLGCAAARVAGVESVVLSVAQFLPTVMLILAVPLLADIVLSPVAPGAGDNASGVATVLRLVERFDDHPLEHFDVWVLFPGAGEGPLLGMRAWMRRHRRELDKRSTVFVNIDAVGHGTVRYVTKEGFVIAQRYHPTLVKLCREIAAEDDDENRFGARSHASRFATDAVVARSRGFPAITITCANAEGIRPHHHQPTDTTDRIEPPALERAYEFCAELAERLDETIGPALEAQPSASAARMPSSD